MAIARDLGISRILIHKYSSILSAYGMTLADVVVETQEPISVVFDGKADTNNALHDRFEKLQNKVDQALSAQGFGPDSVLHENYLNMRYQGTDTALMTAEPSKGNGKTFADAFVERHQRKLGFIQEREILIDDIRLKGIGRSRCAWLSSPFDELKAAASITTPPTPKSSDTCKVYFEEACWHQVPVHLLGSLLRGCQVHGPAMILDKTQTIVLDPASRATILPDHVIVDLVDLHKKEADTDTVDPILLSVFSHRYMSVAEQVSETHRNSPTPSLLFLMYIIS